MSSKNTAAGVFVGIFSGIFILFFGTIFGLAISFYFAWAGSYIWEWFAVPILNLPKLSIIQLMGLMMVAGIFHHKDYLIKKDKRETDWWGTFGAITLGPLFILLIGYIIKSMM